ncbi:MAG TPA: hypothetical protein VN736_02900 [Candidatus Limnocylindrales bacterium]|nr:hypothetical protein [Candidatus Limnocylindrales bacterium]
MKEERIQYRKLPGRLRGILRGASVWQGPDHLLLVQSVRFREEYRRFYFKDVQAIAVAKAPRFYVSARALLPLIAVPFLAAYLIARPSSSLVMILPILIALLLGAWVIVASQFSCRCRIYTAVSSEELPSVSRSWTARRFLARVEPIISAAQGTVDGDWAQRVDDRWWAEGRAVAVGPSGSQFAEALQGETAAPVNPASGRRMGVVGICFAAALLLSAAFDFLTLNHPAAWTRAVPLWFAVAKIVAASFIFIRYDRSRVSSRLRALAIAALVVMGLLFYAGQIRTSVQAEITKSKTVRVDTSGMVTAPVLRGVEAGADVLLGLLAVIVVLRGERS